MKIEQLFNQDNYYPTNILKPKFPLSIERDIIHEGLILSWSINSILSSINLQLDCKFYTIKNKPLKHPNFFAISDLPEKIDFIKLDKILTRAGWYIALANLHKEKQQQKTLSKNLSIELILQEIENLKSDFVELKIEAKYDIEISKAKWSKELYCVAPINVKHKIEKIGLIPKSGPNLDNQPERIYFCLHKDNLIHWMLPELKKNNDSYNEGTILITLDTSRFPDKVRLFNDINYPDKAVYCLVNIPPYCITEVEEV